MANYKYKINPRTGQFNLVNDDGILFFKASVDTELSLPGTGNNKNDARITNDTQNMYIWDGSSWINQGNVLDINWSAIENKPTSLVADIDDSVSKKHIQNSDQKLAEGGSNEVQVASIKNNIHAPNTDEKIVSVHYNGDTRQSVDLTIKCFILYNGKYYTGCDIGYIMETLDFSTYTYTQRQPNSKHVNCASNYNNKLYFGCNDGYIVTFDGTNWVSTLIGVTGRSFVTSIVYNSILYLADTQGYVFEYNGSAWTSTRRSNRRVNCIAVYNSVLYFGAADGYVFTYDGTTWTAEVKREPNSKILYTAIVYNSNLYFGCASGYILIFNGTTWTSALREPNGKQINTSIIDNNNKLYFGCNEGYILTFINDRWCSTLRQVSGNNLRCSISYNNKLYFGTNYVSPIGVFIGVYYEESLSVHTIQTNITDLQTDTVDLQNKSHRQNTDTYVLSQDWEVDLSVGFPVTTRLSGVIAYNGKIYAVYYTGTYPNYTSHIIEFDGTTWTEVYSLLNFTWTIGSLIYHNRLYFFFSSFVVSFDGATWSIAEVTVHGKTRMPVLYNDKLYWAGNEGCVVVLDDTIWTELGVVTTPNPAIFNGIVYNNKLYFGCEGGYIIEFNGTVWSISQREPNGYHLYFTPIVYNNKLYFSCRMLGTPYLTYILEFNGTTWSSALRESNKEYGYPAGIYDNKLYWMLNDLVSSSYLVYDGTNYSILSPTTPLPGYGLSQFYTYNGLTYAFINHKSLSSNSYMIELDNDWLVTQKLHRGTYPVVYDSKLYVLYIDGYFDTFQRTTAEDIADAVDKKHLPESDNQIASTVPTEDSGISVQDALNTVESDKVDKIAGSSLVPDTEISKIHIQNTDTKLDAGGLNEVTAAQLKELSLIGGSADNIIGTIEAKLQLPYTVLHTDTDPDSLNTTIQALADKAILEVNSSIVYNPISIPADKELIIRPTLGKCINLTGTGCIKLMNGARDVIIAGVTIQNCTTVNGNYQGAGITFGEIHAKVSNISFYNISIDTVLAGSGVMLSYHWSESGDDYATANTIEECSSIVRFINCCFYAASKDNTEGASLSLRGIIGTFINNCHFRDNTLSMRQIQLQNCISSYIAYSNIRNTAISGTNSEGIKLDELGTCSFRSSGYIRNNVIKNAVEGIDIDDKVDALVFDNICYECTEEGISIDDSATAVIARNLVYNCRYDANSAGYRIEAGAIVSMHQNNSVNNRIAYRIQNGYVLSTGNSSSIDDIILKDSAKNLVYSGNILTAFNVKEAIDTTYALAHVQETDKYLATAVTKELYVDGNRVDIYVANGSITRPFLTITEALAVVTAWTTINVIPKVTPYIEDIVIPANVSLAGRNKTVISGNVTTSAGWTNLTDLRFIGTGKVLTLNSTTSIRDCVAVCAVVYATTAASQAWNFHIMPPTGIVPLTILEAGKFQSFMSTIMAVGNVPTITMSAGQLILNTCSVAGSRAGALITGTGGTVILISTQSINSAGGTSIDVSANGATATNPNMIFGVISVGNVICGTKSTMVEGLQFISVGTITGTALLYRKAVNISNVPAGTIAATDVQTAINELDTDKISKNGISGSFSTLDGKIITIVDGQVTDIYSIS